MLGNLESRCSSQKRCCSRNVDRLHPIAAGADDFPDFNSPRTREVSRCSHHGSGCAFDFFRRFAFDLQRSENAGQKRRIDLALEDLSKERLGFFRGEAAAGAKRIEIEGGHGESTPNELLENGLEDLVGLTATR